MTPAEEEAEGVELWSVLVRRYTRWCEQLAWLTDNQTDPEWSDVNAKVTAYEAKVDAALQAVYAWTGGDAEAVLLMLAPWERNEKQERKAA